MVAQAQERFSRAAAADPLFARAYSGLARTLLLEREYATLTDAEAYPRAHAAAQQALNIDPKELEKGEKRKYIFLEQLAQATRDPIEMRDQLLSILVAGRDTTAGLLSFMFRLLASHPEVFNKLRNVILEEFGTDETRLTFASLKDCQYLQYCMNETLRLYPSVPLNSRCSTRDTTIPRGGGPDGMSPVFVPKGTEVNYSVYSMHRSTEFWGEDAEDFKPERWNGRKAGFGKSIYSIEIKFDLADMLLLEYLPFNGGPR